MINHMAIFELAAQTKRRSMQVTGLHYVPEKGQGVSLTAQNSTVYTKQLSGELLPVQLLVVPETHLHFFGNLPRLKIVNSMCLTRFARMIRISPAWPTRK